MARIVCSAKSRLYEQSARQGTRVLLASGVGRAGGNPQELVVRRGTGPTRHDNHFSGVPFVLSPAAMVWHHYRRTVRAYWKQQMGYGKAEAMLERKWPEKYNSGGYATWAGRIYVNGIFRTFSLSRGRIYQGTWGTAGYARLYQPALNRLNSLPLTHEWQLTNLVLAALCAVSMFWGRLLGVLPVAAVAFGPLSVMFGAITFRSAAVAVGAIHHALIKLDFERT